jgi:integrase
LQARGDVAANPVPRGLPTRPERQRPHQGVPLVKVTRTPPVILSPAEVDVLTAAMRTYRDRAIVAAMVLGGLRRCEALGLRLEDLPFGGCRSPRHVPSPHVRPSGRRTVLKIEVTVLRTHDERALTCVLPETAASGAHIGDGHRSARQAHLRRPKRLAWY